VIKRLGFDEYLADQVEEYVTGETPRRVRSEEDREQIKRERDYRADFYDCSNTGLGGSL